MEKEVPPVFLRQKHDWMFVHVIWISLHYMLGGAATLAGALVAFSQQSEQLKALVTVFGVVACTTSALTMFFNPSKKASAFFKAHRELNNAIVRYTAVTSCPIEDLVTAHERGERIIATVDG